MRPTRERRRRRSHDTLEALTLQLEACRKAARLDGMVLADADGLLLAAAGDRAACDEIAAHLPLIGQKVGHFEGTLLGPDHGWSIHMRRFKVGPAELYAAAIGAKDEGTDEIVNRGIGGAARILAA